LLPSSWWTPPHTPATDHEVALDNSIAWQQEQLRQEVLLLLHLLPSVGQPQRLQSGFAYLACLQCEHCCYPFAARACTSVRIAVMPLHEHRRLHGASETLH
jgi:hypothetical protein